MVSNSTFHGEPELFAQMLDKIIAQYRQGDISIYLKNKFGVVVSLVFKG
jgi:hypothetical protein